MCGPTPDRPINAGAVSDDEFADAGLEAGVVGVEELDPAGDLTEREPCLLLDQIWMVVAEPVSPGELILERQAVPEPMP